MLFILPSTLDQATIALSDQHFRKMLELAQVYCKLEIEVRALPTDTIGPMQVDSFVLFLECADVTLTIRDRTLLESHGIEDASSLITITMTTPQAVF